MLGQPPVPVRVVVLLLLLVAPLGLQGCRSLIEPSGRHDLNGQFLGGFNDDLVSSILSTLWQWEVQQTGTTVFGTVTATQSGGDLFNGKVFGSLEGDYLYFTVTVKSGGILDKAIGTSTCTMTLSASATVSETAGDPGRTNITGTYSGTRSCGSEIRNGTFLVSRTTPSS